MLIIENTPSVCVRLDSIFITISSDLLNPETLLEQVALFYIYR